MKMSRQRAILLAMSFADRGIVAGATTHQSGASSGHKRRAVPTVTL
jgi:hypothetical protein